MTVTSRLDQFAQQARANEVVNQRMLKVLEAHQELLHSPLTGYFKSINHILSHVYVADSFWTADIAFSAALPVKETIDTVNYPRYENFAFESFDQILRLRAAMDERLHRIVRELTEEKLELPVSDFEHPGQGLLKPVRHCLLHVFNHQTHHRGQISLALESFGVAHNYSNIIDID